MIRRLLEAHYEQFRNEPTPERLRFWLMEMRSPELLTALVQKHPQETQQLSSQRMVQVIARMADPSAIEEALHAEEWSEREKDRQYWEPLKKELEMMRRGRG